MVNELLESKIRKALIKQKADDFCEYVAKSDAYQILVGEFYKKLEGELGDKLVQVSMGSIQEGRFNKAKKRLLADFHLVYYNIDNLRKKIIEEEENKYKDILELKAKVTPKFETAVKAFKSKGVSESVLERLENSFKDFLEGAFGYLETNNKIVKRLTEIAQRDGNCKAMQKETRYSVIKEFFPTPLDYKLHESKFHNLQNKVMQQTENIQVKVSLNEEGLEYAKEVERSSKILSQAIEFYQTLKKAYIEHMVKEIYG